MGFLVNKKVLVLAGPTWVSLDKVRAITNIFTGELGLLIAREFFRKGAKTILLFGPGRRELINLEKDRFKITFFNYFEELLKIVKKEARDCDIVINSAAIADYQPVQKFSGKIKSGQKGLLIKLKPTVKIIDLIRKINPAAVLVKFKLEAERNEKKLIKTAYQSLLFSQANFIVANSLAEIKGVYHKALIMDKNKKIVVSYTKKQTAKILVKVISQIF